MDKHWKIELCCELLRQCIKRGSKVGVKERSNGVVIEVGEVELLKKKIEEEVLDGDINNDFEI